ncbi:VOC family protein [Hymenobacter bucti]|uniref:VOC family protein n=1 Tax=Hymenobacter bucti TaxID=1844114 RepID=A0ABW4R1D9_9BACT
MTIEHVALWTPDLERSRQFYSEYFSALASACYRNPSRQFSSYFLSFAGGARLELMQQPQLLAAGTGPAQGYAHLAFASGSVAAVQALTERLRGDGYPIVSEPRITGDGYYESIVADPDGNLVEITV